MKKNLISALLLTSFIFPLFLQAQNTETLTISTYYPAPTGVYQNLRLFPTAVAPACNANSEGTIYYDNGTNQIMLCQETAPTVFTPVPLGALWTFVNNPVPTPDFIYSNDPNWNVGIGTINPGAKLGVLTTANSNGRNDVLELGHPGNNTLTISEFGGTHAVSPSTVQLGAWNAEQNIAIVTDSKANIQAGGSTKGIFIKTGGNVGIGTTNPQAKLDVAGGLIRGQLKCRVVTNEGPAPSYSSYAKCNNNEWLLSGGGLCTSAPTDSPTKKSYLHANFPYTDIYGSGWWVDCWKTDGTTATDTPTKAYAICCETSP